MLCGIPQGSVIGAILFHIYGGDLQRLIEEHGLCPHLAADDSQIYGSCRPSMYPEMQTCISASIDDVAEWMRSNRFQLKTEILWCASSRRLHQLPTTALRVGSDQVAPSVVVRDLGILLDADVSMKSHVTRTVSTGFFVLRQLRSIRCSVPRSVLQSLVVSLVLSRLDYGNATLIDIPQHLLRRLQSVMNADARLIYTSSRFGHITPLLKDFTGWRQRSGSTSRSLFSSTSVYTGLRRLTSLMSSVVRRTCKVEVIYVLRLHHSWLSVGQTALLSVIGLSWSLVHASGTTYRSTSLLLLAASL